MFYIYIYNTFICIINVFFCSFTQLTNLNIEKSKETPENESEDAKNQDAKSEDVKSEDAKSEDVKNEDVKSDDGAEEQISPAEKSLLQKIIRKGLVETTKDIEVQRKDPSSPLYSIKSFEALHL